ncbi:MAG: hypothetical protein KF795_23100 [Labilithrix sp.]|nr:hypothetical protein [Labilithrix sp.]
MKSTSVLAVAAVVALATVACDKNKKEELSPSETEITSAPIEREPVETTGSTTTTGGATDPDNTQGGVAALGATESANGKAAGGTTGTTVNSGRDGGAYWPAVPIDRKGTSVNGEPATPTGERNAAPTMPKGERNTSTTLGDGTSGMYTGGKGTYGGKATHGTGTPTDGTASDKPAPDPRH